MRCPCSKCLIEPICTEPCPNFSEFIKPIDKGCQFLEKFFEKIDSWFQMDTIPDKIYNWTGEHIIEPVIFYLLTSIFAIKTNRTGAPSKFDERWEKCNDLPSV